ncbi:class I poly(R)-hydroxyalkanoic acid synthase [Altererythrobacter sp. ZODW24]|uniref:PHA/PHB synthase family protein n=1 Tax=Altererythrobacter sp. ZODW24 TaxID=2185142 RepID=UPI000DF77123|nr:class I poly(R)-hydroxyalkanoic acid synthase [Altererythrobacter sp. ZODW24]
MSDDPLGDMNELVRKQTEAMQTIFGALLPGGEAKMPTGDAEQWQKAADQLKALWAGIQSEQSASTSPLAQMIDPAQWMGFAKQWYAAMPLADPAKQKALWDESVALWQGVMAQYNMGPNIGTAPKDGEPDLPRKDRRFADPKWRSHPAFALIHQTYLMLAERIEAMVDEVEGLDKGKREQLRFATRTMVEAMSPSNIPLANPVVLDRTVETKGQNLVKGMEHLLADLKKGQLTHTDPEAFTLGENVATTPGKVVHETPLYQLIQYSPSTPKVTETPLVIFPPWLNRFYILDLNEKKSFVRWVAEQGVTVFVASWKSADSAMKDVVWDDYIAAQIDAVDHIRSRLKVPSVHTIGYCVAGTTLAATLAVLERRGEADKVKSATFFTAQVDFSRAGELNNFIDDKQIKAIEGLTTDGYLDGRYLALTFNLLRSKDLIWNYVVNNYMLGEDYPAFDMLHWNGDVTNLPGKWHSDYLRDLYRDNKLVTPDALSAGGTPIDLTRVKTPSYIQAGKEDHIAPAKSVYKMTEHFAGPMEFVLAGSGHIAGVVNPPSSRKYQYWTNDADCASLSEFVDGASETPGSWWPHWMDWLKGHGDKQIAATGKRKPGGKGDKVIEDAPGRYVKTR